MLFRSRAPSFSTSLTLSLNYNKTGVTFAYVEHANVILLAMTRANANAAAMLVYLHRLKDGERKGMGERYSTSFLALSFRSRTTNSARPPHPRPLSLSL